MQDIITATIREEEQVFMPGTNIGITSPAVTRFHISALKATEIFTETRVPRLIQMTGRDVKIKYQLWTNQEIMFPVWIDSVIKPELKIMYFQISRGMFIKRKIMNGRKEKEINGPMHIRVKINLHLTEISRI